MQRDNLVDHTENGEILQKLIADKREVGEKDSPNVVIKWLRVLIRIRQYLG
jgi:hypothetical protein